MTAITEETLSVSGILLTKTFGQQQAATDRFRVANVRLGTLQLRQSMVGRWFFMIVGTVFSITPAFVYWLAGILHGHAEPARRSATSWPSPRSRAGCSSRSASCSACRWRCRARSPCSTASSSTWTWSRRSSTPPTRSIPTPSVRGQVRYAHVSFRYPTAPPAGRGAGR